MDQHTFSRRALGALAATAGVGLAAAPAEARPRGPVSLKIGAARPDRSFTEALNRFGDRRPGWSGGDSTYSVPMDGHTSALIFSDTFLGPVRSDGTRSKDSPFLHNSMVLTDGPTRHHPAFHTVTGHHHGTPDSLVSTTDDHTNWYWFGAGARSGPGRLQVMALHFQRTGSGVFDFAWVDTAVATLTRQGHLVDLSPVPGGAEIQWASWIERIGSHQYVYGVRDHGDDKRLFLARVPAGRLASRPCWRFWTGSTWSAREADAAEISRAVANEVSVAAFGGGYLLITQDTSVALNTQVVASYSSRPEGPFTTKVPLLTMQTSGTRGTQVYAYNAHEHPQWRERGSLLVSYNVNSFDSEELYTDASIYRPRFVRVPVTLERTRH